jgi:hypothetical protein
MYHHAHIIKETPVVIITDWSTQLQATTAVPVSNIVQGWHLKRREIQS